MAYDAELTERLRKHLRGLSGVSEKRMMGGVCFMLDGHMIGGADRPKSGVPRFMFRVGKQNEAYALNLPGAIPVEQGGRRMSGMVFVDAASTDESALKEWLDLALSFVRSLPPR